MSEEKLNQDPEAPDSGGSEIIIGIHPQKKVIVFTFDRPAKWFAMTPDQARDFLTLVLDKVDRVEEMIENEAKGGPSEEQTNS